MMGVPLKVIQRDLGHAGPEMSAHYIALLDEDAEEAFYATKKFDARGREIEVANRDLWELEALDMIIARIREERTKGAETGDVIHAYIVGGGVPARDVAARRARSA